MKRGFTLMEMILVIVVLAVVGLVGVVVLKEGAEIYASSSRQRESYESARLALDRVVREIRELNNDSITAATGTRLSFTNPYHTALSGVTNPVVFRLADGTLERSGDGGASWEPLAEDVANTELFTYYKIESGSTTAFTPAAPYDDIQWILVTVEIGEGMDAAILRQQVCLVRDRL